MLSSLENKVDNKFGQLLICFQGVLKGYQGDLPRGFVSAIALNHELVIGEAVPNVDPTLLTISDVAAPQ